MVHPVKSGLIFKYLTEAGKIEQQSSVLAALADDWNSALSNSIRWLIAVQNILVMYLIASFTIFRHLKVCSACMCTHMHMHVASAHTEKHTFMHTHTYTYT